LEENALTGEFVAGIVYLIAAVRLFRRGQRNGESAERLLAAAFFFVGVSSFLYTVAQAPGFESMQTPLNFVARIIYLPTPILMTVFTRRVFRADAVWAFHMVWPSCVLLGVGVAGSVAFRSDWEGFSVGSPWFWLEWLGFTYPFVWAGTEAFLQYRQARRRVQLQLCDPLVCNRLLLWASFGALQICANIVLFPQYAEFEAQQIFGSLWDAVYGGFAIASIVMLWLVFFPPKFYKHWVSVNSRPPAAVGA